MIEDAKNQAKLTLNVIGGLEQNHLESNKFLKIPEKLNSSIDEHKRPVEQLLKDILNQESFQNAESNDKEIRNFIEKIDSRLNSDINKLKVETKTLVKYLVDINSEIKKSLVDLEIIKNNLKDLQLQAKNLRDFESSVLIIKTPDSMADEIVNKARDMMNVVGETSFNAELEKIVDLVMNYATSLKKDAEAGEKASEELSDKYKEVTLSYKELVTKLGFDWH